MIWGQVYLFRLSKNVDKNLLYMYFLSLIFVENGNSKTFFIDLRSVTFGVISKKEKGFKVKFINSESYFI